MEATQTSMDRWMGTENVTCTYTRILFSLEIEIELLWYNEEKPWEHLLNEGNESQKDILKFHSCESSNVICLIEIKKVKW